MRHILVDHARMRLAAKRGGGEAVPLLKTDDIRVDARAAELLDLDQALERLNGADERLGQIVDLRFFAGLSVEETADLMALSPRTVKREWRKARAFLYDAVASHSPSVSPA
jgi:RNA polymerase sigma factor (TIGR02999 family)